VRVFRFEFPGAALNLGRRFVLGSVYLSGGQVVINAANLAMQLVIARELGPEVFGLYVFCLAITEFLNILGAVSLGFALIQSREASQSDYDTAFFLYLGLGVLGLFLVAGIAPWLAEARSTEAAWLLLVMWSARALRMLAQMPEARLERDLRYGALTGVNLFVGTVPNVVAVALAWWGWGVWSLGIRDVLVSGLLLGVAGLVSGYRFRGRFSRDSYGRLMGFARPMMLSRGLEILIERLDALAVGAFLGNRAAGLYAQGRFLAETGTVATRPVERVSFNLYARVQDDPQRLARSWHVVNYFLLRVMLVGAAALLVFPDEILRLLLGPEWLGAAPILRWLALYAGLFPLLQNARSLLYGLGEVRRMVRVRIYQAAAFAIGVTGAVLAGSATWMAAGLLLTTLLALSLAWRETLDLVAPPRTAHLVVPVVLFAGVVSTFGVLSALGWWEALPWFALPFLPPLAYLVALFVVERGRLVAECRYLFARLGEP